MDLPRLLRKIGPGLSGEVLAGFAPAWTPFLAAKGTVLATQGVATTREVMILDGRAASTITDAAGREVCVGLHAGPCIITPHVARTREGVSLVNLTLTAEATIAGMETDDLMSMMLATPEIRDWANAVLRDELARKTDREWCLAALGGSERLAWFRDRYPVHEDLFAHGLIASFLGMTPVTLSRLRNAG